MKKQELLNRKLKEENKLETLHELYTSMTEDNDLGGVGGCIRLSHSYSREVAKQRGKLAMLGGEIKIMKDLNYNEAIELMKKHREETDDIAVFTDRGWGDDPDIETLYSIIRDGNGQKPLAYISKETFKELMKNKELSKNYLQTYKARTLHYFRMDEEE